MIQDAQDLANELNEICKVNNFVRLKDRLKVGDIDKKLQSSYFCPGGKTKKFEDIVNNELMSSPE